MSKDKEKKLKNNEIDIENENISGGCHCERRGGMHSPHHGPGRRPMGGHWAWIPDNQEFMPPPPPNFDKNPMTPNPEQNSVTQQSPDSSSNTESSTPGQ